jgi:hypothetical protein
MADDDDLRFGDVGGGDSGGGGGLGADYAPLAVGVLVAGFLIVGQPLTTSLGGLSMNIVGALICIVGGLLGTFQ